MDRWFGAPLPAPRSDRERLVRIIRSVRRRWRLRVALRGTSIVLAVGLAAFLLSALGVDTFELSPAAITAFRGFAYATVIVVAVRFLVVPALRRVPAETVALYLEEHEPTLAGQMLTAVEFSGASPAGREAGVSSALVERGVQRALERCAQVGDGRRIERAGLRRWGGALSGATVLGAALLLLRPGFIGHGAPFLLTPWAAGEAHDPFGVAVAPGDTVLARGADLAITARPRNFDPERVELALREGASETWERWPMVGGADGAHEFMLLDVDSLTEYFVEAGGVRSPVYRIEVRDLPYVSRIDLEYRFPAYTGLAPVTEEDGGEIAALIGTEVHLTISATLPVSAGRLVVAERDTIALVPAGATTLTGVLRVEAEGFYHVLLAGPDGQMIVASPDYYIDPLTDQPPSVRFTQPGRDLTASSVDEVLVEVSAEDDYGIGSAELVYAVNGGPERTISLYAGGGRKSVTAAHTFYLEEQPLKPGDVVSYHAHATDARSVPAQQTGATDIYFITIRRFDQRYRQAESGGQPQGGGGGGDVGELSQRQREIVAATFKLSRDSATYDPDEMRENLATLALAQGRLREEVQTLIGRIAGRRVVELDSTFQAVAEALPPAGQAMEEAETRLGERQPKEALSPEQRALQYLQRAEAAFREREVREGNQGGGGGGGRQAASAEDLADLFDLELDKLRNQYEEVDRGRREAGAQEVDELMEKIRELARRQQQENERMRARTQNRSGGGGGGTQRQLAEEAEEVARRLERLSRERSQPALDESARRLREAADAMRRAATSGGESTARGQTALDRLREVRRRLEQTRSAELEQAIRDALERAGRLAEDQRSVTEEVGRLEGDGRDAERVRRLLDRKNQMADQVRGLESDLTELARGARADQPEAARRLDEAARGMRDDRLADKILYSRGVVQGRSPDYARNFEEQIGKDLGRLEQRIQDALGQVGESREQRLSRSLDQTRDMVSALESLSERMRRAADGRGERPDSAGAGDRRLDRRGEPGAQPSQEGPPGGSRPSEGQAQGQPNGARPGGGGRLSPEEARQFRRELGLRRDELTDLRRQLGRDGVNSDRLDGVLRDLEAFANRGPTGDPRGLDALESEVIAGLKEFEYLLRRQLAGGDPERLFLSGSDEVPPEYRQLVEEYYRALSRGRR